MAAGETIGAVQASADSQGALSLHDVAVVIPVWQPEAALPGLVAELQQAGLRHVILVDDGSTADRQPIFDELAQRSGVAVCRHERNLGKGRALKTAFAHVLGQMPTLQGVVTADADGQHLPADIVRVAQQLASEPQRPVLGVRRFAAGVPFRSRFGNLLTRRLFRLITGYKVSDTQTGLRGLPVSLLPELLKLPGERYEYEMVMLARLCQNGGRPSEVPIQTVYLNGNRGSHFHFLRDSLCVYRMLFRFLLQRRRKALPGTGEPAKPRLRTA